MQKQRVLIVEDEEAIRVGLTDLLVFHGFDVHAVADGNEGLTHALSECFDVIVLDVMLPGINGFFICDEIRKRDRRQPILMLTAKSSEEDIIEGLSLGADDYITKPFSPRELVLRIKAVLRRTVSMAERRSELKLGSLIIDPKNLVGRCGAETIEFTRKEVDILLYLEDHDTAPVSREELLEEVWGYERAAQIETRTVDIHVAKLRRKIEPNPKEPRFLLTQRGEGYKLTRG